MLWVEDKIVLLIIYDYGYLIGMVGDEELMLYFIDIDGDRIIFEFVIEDIGFNGIIDDVRKEVGKFMVFEIRE